MIHLGLTKGGKRRGAPEQVIVTDRALTDLLRGHVKGKAAESHLLEFDANAFRRYFQNLLGYFELGEEGYSLHSLRRGGATHHFRKTGCMASTLERGRWTDIRTGRGYITEGLAVLGLHGLRADVSRSLVDWSVALSCQMGDVGKGAGPGCDP